MRRWRDLPSATRAALQIAGTLSGGERLRAGFACVFARPQPPLLLLMDEPTNHLDLASIEELESALRRFRRRADRGQPRSDISAGNRNRARDRALTQKRANCCSASAGRGGGLATCGVSESGGRGLGLMTAPGAGLTSIGGGSGATCGWLAIGGGRLTGGALAAGRQRRRARRADLRLLRQAARIAAGHRRVGYSAVFEATASGASGGSSGMREAAAAVAAARRARSRQAGGSRDRSPAPPAMTTAPSHQWLRLSASGVPAANT